MAKSQSLLLPLLQLLAVATTITFADVSITLTDIDDSNLTFCDYSKPSFRDKYFSNVPRGGMEGFLAQPDLKDGCSNISPIPGLEDPGSSTNVSWFAIIKDYPSCVESLISNVKKAGYKLVIASSSTGSKNQTLIGKYNFPIVIVTENYTDYLIESAISNFTNPQIKAVVRANADLFMAVVSMVFVVMLLLVCLLCCYLFCYCRMRRTRQYRDITDTQRQRNFDRLQEHDNIARRELIESILRQLQQLHLDGEVQQPLGMEKTKKLPVKKYQRVSSIVVDTCAICVDDFKEGDTQRVLPCHHSFHIKCVDEWLNYYSNLCPLCKNKVPYDKGDELLHSGRRGSRNPMVLLTEDDTDDYPLVRTSRTGRQGGGGERYGSV